LLVVAVLDLMDLVVLPVVEVEVVLELMFLAKLQVVVPLLKLQMEFLLHLETFPCQLVLVDLVVVRELPHGLVHHLVIN
jgi:hypothetical protein|tara:strand:- start:352 stop:588 length:237 start_codon:yes stop_codon:yes gene_type:complete